MTSTMTARGILFELDDDTLIRAAREALTRPSDFGYFGSVPLFESWGLTMTRTRDSDLVTESNFRSLVRDLAELITNCGDDPAEYMDQIHCGHWMFGWIDHMAVRVLIDPEGDVTPDNITGPFRWIAFHAVSLAEQHPVYDESDHSELESDAEDHAWSDWYRKLCLDEITEQAERAVPVDARDSNGKPYTSLADYLADARDANGQPFGDAEDYITETFESREDDFRSAYFEDSEWSEESGSGMVNHSHDRNLVHAAGKVFGWDLESPTDIRVRNARHRDTVATTWAEYLDQFPLPHFANPVTRASAERWFVNYFEPGATVTVEAIRAAITAEAERAAYKPH